VNPCNWTLADIYQHPPASLHSGRT
jgi:hypothetical protein